MITFCTLFSGSSGNAVYFATDQGALLVDCGMSGRQVLDALCAAIGAHPEVVVVTNEVGLGVVPAHRSGVLFRDLLGVVNQRVAAVCDEVHLVICGRVLVL